MKETHAVTDGRVFCVVQRRPVDVITCYACERVVEIDLDSRRPRVTCEVPAPAEDGARA